MTDAAPAAIPETVAPPRPPNPGERVAPFAAPTAGNPNYKFDTVGGRYVVLAVVTPDTLDQALAALKPHRQVFDDDAFVFFGVAPDTPDMRARALDDIPGIRWFFDGDGALARRLGPGWLLLDPLLRVLGRLPGPELLEQLKRLPPADLNTGAPPHAPVLLAPRIFEPALCETLIKAWRDGGGEPSGFMRDIEGKTTRVHDLRHKSRRDHMVEDEALMTATRERIRDRLLPLIDMAFQFKVTRLERYLVARYGADEGGWFRPHRDNTTFGTAHRRFAVSINLNQDFEGGDLRFPEFGSRTYRPPLGGAVVFSCSLLHEATPVTKGQRFAFLPFLYDEAAARIRAANLDKLASDEAAVNA